MKKITMNGPIIFLLWLGCCSAGLPEGIIARVSDQTLSQEEFKAFVKEEYKVAPASLDSGKRRNAAEAIVARKMLAAEARKKGLDNVPDLKQAIFRWKLENYPEFFWMTQVRAKIEVRDEELREFVDPVPMYNLSAIVLPGGEEGEEEAAEVLEKLNSGASFENLARERSLGFTAGKGGEVGWQTIPNMIVPEDYVEDIARLSIGEHTKPLESPIGWIIFLLQDKKEEEQVFQEQRENALRDLIAERYNEEKSRVMAELRDKATIVYPAKSEGAPPGTPLAVVDGVAILPQMIDSMEPLQHQFSFQEVYPPEQKLEKFINAILLVREVEKRGLDKGGEIALRLELKKVDLLASLLIEKETGTGKDVSEEEMKQEYEIFYQPVIYRLQVVKTVDREKAEESYERLEAGEAFGTVARDYNSGSLAESEGLLGWMPLSRFTASIREAIESLTEDGYTGILPDNQGGFLIFRLIGSQEVKVPEYESVKERIRARLELKKRGDRVGAYMEEKLSSVDIEVNEKLLSSF